MWSRLQDLDLLDPAKRSGPRELDPTRPGTLPSPRRSMTDNLPTFSFTLLLSGPDATESPVIDLLHEAGCDDALFGQRDQIQYGGFDRDAKSLAEAVISAIRQVESVPGLCVLRVEPDELVSATVIAERTKRSRESVRLLVEGKRGPGGFPAPISWVDAKRRLWQWSDVARWFADELGIGRCGDHRRDQCCARDAESPRTSRRAHPGSGHTAREVRRAPPVVPRPGRRPRCSAPRPRGAAPPRERGVTP